MLKHAKLNDCVGKKLTKVVWCNLQVYLVFEDVYAGVGDRQDEDGETYISDISIYGGDHTLLLKVGVITKEEAREKQRLQAERTRQGQEKQDRELYERLRKKFEVSDNSYRG